MHPADEPTDDALVAAAAEGDEEGLCLGLSSGINVAGAVALAKQLGAGSRVATILCDTGFRYLSTLYNNDWLASKGLVPA